MRKLIFLFGVFVFGLFPAILLNMDKASAGLLVISNLTAASGKSYEIVENGLQNGAMVYVDRGYTYSSIPGLLQGAIYIKTANDDKASSSASFLTFEVNRDVIVYVAHDTRISPKPAWLNAFMNTGETLVTTDVPLDLYELAFPAGLVNLGGNQNSSNSNTSMYSVVIIGQGGALLDTTPPVITLVGANPQIVERGTPYTELGATALDNLDGDMSGTIVIDASSVDTTTVGDYVVTYNVSDGAGNPAVQVTRTVNVLAAPVPPTITMQPTNVTVAEPNSATFMVLAAGMPPLSYQWRRNGSGIDGATSATYVVNPTNELTDDGAQFDVVVTNGAGSVTSATALLTVTASPPICPRWAFEPWVWEDNTNTRFSSEALVKGYKDRNIPVGAIIIDSPWETYYNTLKWDTSRYSNPQQMIDQFHSQGVKVIMWITGFVNNDSPDYDFVKNQGFVVNNGQDFSWWKGVGVHIDFTNASAKNWWHSKMDNMLNMGIDGWKCDKGADQLTNSVTTSIGNIPKQDFKKYYYADFYDYSVSRNPQAIIIARAYSHQGGIGALRSKSPISWQGDFRGDFEGLNDQKNDIYTSAQMQYAAPGVEVGGFMYVNPTKRSLIRYAQFGAMTPLMENGGMNGGETNHLPWYYDTQTVDIYRYFATLHSELVPYVFSYSVEAHLTGRSILRDTNSSLNHHKLGEEIFVSVLTSDVTSKNVDFPSGGKWIDYWDETKVFDGGTSTNYSVPLDQYPVFIKAGAIIPMNVKNIVTGHGDNNSTGKTTLVIYPFGKSSLTYHHPSGEGTDYSNISIVVDESSGTIDVDGNVFLPYRIRVKSFVVPSSVIGVDSWYYDTAGQYVVIDKQGMKFQVTINGLTGYEGGIDSTPPVIILLGNTIETVEVGTAYVDAGATAFDVGDGDVTGSIVTTGLPIDTSTVGTFQVTYNVTDGADNPAVEVTRTVTVQDTTPPVIMLQGSNPQQLVIGTSYTELGATATDLVPGDLTGVLVIDSSAVIVNAAGFYPVTYDVQDSSGNTAVQVTRTVTVVEASSGPVNITNVTVGSGKTYEVVSEGLQNGAMVYIDRGYTYSSVPALLQGATYLKTANDDKGSSNASFLTFEVNQDVIVYVAHDDRITPRPSWLTSSFSDTGDNLVTTDTTLSIFESNYLAGTVTLGGNEGPNDSMYSVVIVGQGGSGGTNQAPDGAINTPVANQTISADDPVDFTGTGTDPDTGQTLTYLWNFGAASGIADSTVEDPGPKQFNNTGTFVVTFTVTDSLGLSDPTPDTRTITVQSVVTCTDDYEPDDTLATAFGPLTSGNSYDGKICSGTDEDWFKIEVGGTGTISLNMIPPQSPCLNFDISLHDFNGTQVDASTLGGCTTENITYDATTTGTYYIHVYGFQGAFDEDQTYTLSGTWPASAGPLVISNLTAASGKNYEVVENGLQNGAMVYIDRSYTYNSVPALLHGATYIKTANNDKRSSNASFLSFEVNQDVIVYVAHDDRITPKPSWLTSSFTNTGDILIIASENHSIFESNFLTGTVTLGGNEGINASSMYTVIIVGQ